jgi:nucleotide-binding universal stress UspA family protein
VHKQILVAVDGSPSSDAALREALELAACAHAKLRIAHAMYTARDYPYAISGFVPGDLEELQERWRKLGQDILDRGLASARQAGVAAESVLLELSGRGVSSAIVDEAKRCGADLIIVGTHGHRGIQRFLLGSVADGVARTTPVSVLLVRGADPAEQK